MPVEGLTSVRPPGPFAGRGVRARTVTVARPFRILTGFLDRSYVVCETYGGARTMPIGGDLGTPAGIRADRRSRSARPAWPPAGRRWTPAAAAARPTAGSTAGPTAGQPADPRPGAVGRPRATV